MRGTDSVGIGRRKKAKLRIVLAEVDGAITITELCKRKNINTGQSYIWRRHLLVQRHESTNLPGAKIVNRRR